MWCEYEAEKRSLYLISLWGVKEARKFVVYMTQCPLGEKRNQFWSSVKFFIDTFKLTEDDHN